MYSYKCIYTSTTPLLVSKVGFTFGSGYMEVCFVAGSKFFWFEPAKRDSGLRRSWVVDEGSIGRRLTGSKMALLTPNC